MLCAAITCQLEACLTLPLQESHVAKLAGGQDFGGAASLQNALDMAVNSLKSVPPYGHREVCSSSPARAQPASAKARSMAVHVDI